MKISNDQSVPQNMTQTRAWLMIVAGAFFYGYQFILRVAPNMITDELMSAFSIDATKLGIFSSCFYIAYASILLPLGVAMDKWGPRYLLAGAGLICASGCLIFSTTNSAFIASIGRLMMGLGAASGFLGTLKLGTMWLPARSFGKVIALTLTLGTLGAVLGGTPLEFVLNKCGWRNTINILAAIGVILSACLFFLIKNKKQEHHYHETGLLEGLKNVISSRQAWISSLYGMLMYTPLIIVGDLWGVSYLERLYNIKESIAAPIISSLFIGIAVGSPCFALLSDHLRKRRIPMIISAIICTLLYCVILYVASIPIALMYVCFFLAGFFFGGKALGFATIVEVLPSHVSGVAVGFANMLIMGSGIFTLPLVGYLLDASKLSSQITGDMSQYSLSDFKIALSIIPIALILASILSVTIQETYPEE